MNKHCLLLYILFYRQAKLQISHKQAIGCGSIRAGQAQKQKKKKTTLQQSTKAFLLGVLCVQRVLDSGSGPTKSFFMFCRCRSDECHKVWSSPPQFCFLSPTKGKSMFHRQIRALIASSAAHHPNHHKVRSVRHCTLLVQVDRSKQQSVVTGTHHLLYKRVRL